MPGARSTTSLDFTCGRTSAMRGSWRCVTKRPCSSTTIQARSRSRPASVSTASFNSTPAQDLTGYMNSRAIRSESCARGEFMSRTGGYCSDLQPRLCPAPTIERMAIAPDVCIRGAGVAGRTLALLLARDRLRVGLVGDSAAGRRRLERRARLCVEQRVTGAARARARLAGRAACGGRAGHGSAWRRGRPGPLRRQGAPGPPRWRGSSTCRPCSSDWPKRCAISRWSNGWTRRCRPRSPWSAKAEHSATRAEFGVQFDVTAYSAAGRSPRGCTVKNHTDQIARQWFSGGDILAFLPLRDAAASQHGNSVAIVWSVDERRAPSCWRWTTALSKRNSKRPAAMRSGN